MPRRSDDVLPFEDICAQDVTAATQRMFNLGLLSSVIVQRQLSSAQPQTLTAWLHLTNTCNLRCTYCYVSKSSESMSDDIGRQAVSAVFRTAKQQGFTSLKLKYAGGEPTLKFELLKALQQQARALAAQTQLGLQATVLSNGVSITHAMLEYFRAENIRLAISLDGVGDAHDQQRPLINGRGSFVRVARTIDRAIAVQLKPHLSITVTPHTADRLAEIVSFALDRELFFNLNFARDCEAAPSPIDVSLDHGRLIDGLRAALAVIATRLPRHRLIDGLLDRSAFNAPHEYACGVGRSSVVIDQRGRVSRCQMDMANPVTHISAADLLHDIQVNPADYQAVPVSARPDCADCTWRYWCAGGCPLLTRRLTGRVDAQSSYCDVYRAIYPDIVRLEGLRLLKWGSDDHLPD